MKIYKNFTVVGFWPANIFAKMREGANQVEWGGESYSPLGVPAPGMGSGHVPVYNSRLDAYASNINVVLKDTLVDPGALETFTDNEEYHFAVDGGLVDIPDHGHLVGYGGRRGLIVR